VNSLAGKAALVTGAAAGIGRAYAEALGSAGCRLALVDINPEVSLVCDVLRAEGCEVVPLVGDLKQPESAKTYFEVALGHLGSVDILVNNAAEHRRTTPDDPLTCCTEDDFDALMDVNLRAVFLLGRMAGAQMIRQGRGGHIVNIATDHGFTCGEPFDLCPRLPTCTWTPPRPIGSSNADIYDLSKSATYPLTYVWSQELRHHGIRVNSICMGATDSPMIRKFFEDNLTPEMLASWMAPQQSAQVLLDLLGEGPNGRTGQMINLCVGRPPRLEAPLPDLYVPAQGAGP
jgi:NAD(P)-dependent dehydrogenase (short-subunit alcohol dehydrogenase family)